MAIKVRFSRDNMGCVTAYPINPLWQKAFALHIETLTGNHDYSAFFQGGTDDLAGEIPSRQLKDLANGWDVTCLVDPWTFGHWLGWDAHTVAEKGPRHSIRHSLDELARKER